MNSLLDPMLTFYREQCEALEKILAMREAELKTLREENRRMRNSFDRLEEFAEEQEERANALHRVFDTMIERQTYGDVRRDLLDSFNEVANELGIELQLYEVEDLISDSSSEGDFIVAEIDDNF